MCQSERSARKIQINEADVTVPSKLWPGEDLLAKSLLLIIQIPWRCAPRLVTLKHSGPSGYYL